MLKAVILVAHFAAITQAACNANNCARAVTGTNGLPAVSSRRADCSVFLAVTMTPEPSTVLVSTTLQQATVTPPAVTVTDTVTVTSYSVAAVRQKRAFGNPAVVVPRVTEPAVASSKQLPVYASACSDLSQYSSACSCWGVTASTVTLPASTVTATVTETPAPVTLPPLTATVTATATVIAAEMCSNPSTIGCSERQNCGSNGSCGCRQSREGYNFCYDANTPCGATCNSSADCATGSFCTQSCCGTVCVPAQQSCVNAGAVALLFKPRGSAFGSTAEGADKKGACGIDKCA